MRTLSDAEIEQLATAEVVTASMREAVTAAWRGDFLTPPRVTSDMGDQRVTFTCGRVPGDWFGYRSYLAPGNGTEDQVVIVQDETTGQIRAVAFGSALGPRRVGGIGAVALTALAPTTPAKIALIGTGTQAWHQLWALPEQLRGLPISVASRTMAARDRFTDQARHQLDLNAQPASEAVEAARDADIVILATSSRTPVLAGIDIKPGALVATVGPKQTSGAEFGTDLATAATVLASDSPAQIGSYNPPHVLAGTDHAQRVIHLGAILDGAQDIPDGTRLFLNTGLAGTEAWLLNEIARH